MSTYEFQGMLAKKNSVGDTYLTKTPLTVRGANIEEATDKARALISAQPVFRGGFTHDFLVNEITEVPDYPQQFAIDPDLVEIDPELIEEARAALQAREDADLGPGYNQASLECIVALQNILRAIDA